MPRLPSVDEKRLVMTLVGANFPDMDILKEQLENCRVEDFEHGLVLEFIPLSSNRMRVRETVLGDGSYYDVDGTPVFLTLLQRDGYLWRLDICRPDERRIRTSFEDADVKALGFRWGLTLEP
jgi:hypothetical protein